MKGRRPSATGKPKQTGFNSYTKRGDDKKERSLPQSASPPLPPSRLKKRTLCLHPGRHSLAGALAGGQDEVQPLQAVRSLGARLRALQLGGDAGGEPAQLVLLHLPARNERT